MTEAQANELMRLIHAYGDAQFDAGDWDDYSDEHWNSVHARAVNAELAMRQFLNQFITKEGQ